MCSSQVKMDRKEKPSRYTAAIHHGAGNSGADPAVDDDCVSITAAPVCFALRKRYKKKHCK